MLGVLIVWVKKGNIVIDLKGYSFVSIGLESLGFLRSENRKPAARVPVLR